MKKHLLFFLLFLFPALVFAQAPQAIPYQAEARNSSGAILASTPITLRFTIRNSTSTGSVLYMETQSVTTTALGMFNVNVGQGTPVSGTFASINWGTNAKFLQVELDPTGGSSYINMGTQQLMSVPYALYAGSMKLTVSATGDTLYSGGTNFVIVPGISAANSPSPLTIGISYGGGKIAYILQPGDPGYVAGETHGLIAAPSDQSTGITWGCNGTLLGGTSTALGTGAANTAIVSAACGAGTAARLCSDLVLGGYSDWYLPSLNELQKLYINRSSIGGFATVDIATYLSSSEYNNNIAWLVNFVDGESLFYGYKDVTYLIRAVRSF